MDLKSIVVHSTISESNAIIINSEEEYRDFINKIKNKPHKDQIGMQKQTTMPQPNHLCNGGIIEISAADTGYANLIFQVYVGAGSCNFTEVIGGAF
ncbi:hypothetical protein [Autumnicola musiva]|uniref:Uncharacterized protein n=1 Tax=Autumnicola musiva TaxID=3075589 RepID=A0ABU3DAI2_9FLAO|nr:hypothetical protein [Zunongwangia sp. F117]MDT0678533.1 hypothetical protein [Zunongwangia sp. F117]